MREQGSATAWGARTPSRAVFRAPAEHRRPCEQENHSVTATRLPLTGEGAGQHTRGRVCSPGSTRNS